MKFYEIRNTKTQQSCGVTAKDFSSACKSLGWKPHDCRCVWKSTLENGY